MFAILKKVYMIIIQDEPNDKLKKYSYCKKGLSFYNYLENIAK